MSGYSGCCAAGRSRQVASAATAWESAFTVTGSTLRGRVDRFSHGSKGETQVCCKVRRMFAHSTRNWWWTAPPAAR
ncbi:trp operon leader peptide [Streptomyces sp. V2]|nr:trp operon leader peptide [Streptomyces sp. V2]